jgi:virginiamycin B lyase
VPPNTSGPEGMAVGPDGNLWVGVQYSNQIARVTPAGVVTMYSVPTPNGDPIDITRGPDGYMWFAEYGAVGKLGRINPINGQFSEIPLPRPTQLWGVAVGPDHNIWFTEFSDHAIGEIRLSDGHLFEYTTPLTVSTPSVIIPGPNNDLWFTEEGGGQIGRITVDGHITEFPLPNQGADPGPCGIVVGPDGNIWFAEQGAGKIGRLTLPDHVFTLFDLPTPNSDPTEMAIGPDGNIWIAEGQINGQPGNQLARMIINGTQVTFTEFKVPTPASIPYSVITGPGHKLWFTEDAATQVGAMDLFPHMSYLPLTDR